MSNDRIISDLVSLMGSAKEIVFDSNIVVKKTPHTPALFISGVRVTDRDSIEERIEFRDARTDMWSVVEDRTPKDIIYSINQRLRLMRYEGKL